MERKKGIVFIFVKDGKKDILNGFKQTLIDIPNIDIIDDLTEEIIIKCLHEDRDVFSIYSNEYAEKWRKKYPDSVIFIKETEEDTNTGPYVDYAVSGELKEQLKGIILAEKSRRKVINSRKIIRHSFDYTATGVLLNHNRTHIFLIPKAEGIWFPPGGHVEDGEYPHEALMREVREETGYEITFFKQQYYVDMQIGSALVLPQPYWILLEDITTHYHYDLIYLCCALNNERTESEFVGQWVELSSVFSLKTPEDVQYIVRLLLDTGISQ